MQHHIICPKIEGLFFLLDFNNANYQKLLLSSALYKILYNQGEKITVFIDTVAYQIETGAILFCKPLNTVQVFNAHDDLKVVAYNKDFYQLSTTQEEAEFYWFWYFGAKHPYAVTLDNREEQFIKMMYDCMEREFHQHNGCIETERDLLKRVMAISIGRLEIGVSYPAIAEAQLHIIKRFSLLIEEHFKKRTSFEEVVKTLNRKTPYLEQLFKKYFSKGAVKGVKEKLIQESKETGKRIEQGIELQYNSRLNSISKTEKQQIPSA